MPTPMRLAPQPHWKTATITPYAAPTESRFMITALSGTSRLRNTIMSRTNESRSTKPTTTGSIRAVYEAKSSAAAGNPPTATLAVVPAVASGTM